MSSVEVTDYDECVSKSIHPMRNQNWWEHVSLLERDEGLPAAWGDETAWEQAGIVDITSMIKRKSSKKSKNENGGATALSSLVAGVATPKKSCKLFVLENYPSGDFKIEEWIYKLWG